MRKERLGHWLREPDAGRVGGCQRHAVAAALPQRSYARPEGDLHFGHSPQGAAVPATLQRIDLIVSVVGRQVMQSFSAAINQRTTFTWDGRDAYERLVQGQQPVSVRIGYVYGAIKLQPGEGSSRAFANLSRSGVIVSGDVNRQEIIFWKEWQDSLGPWDARAAELGGWTLSGHHAYDPAGKVLHLGDGGRRSARSLPPTSLRLWRETEPSVSVVRAVTEDPRRRRN